MNAGNVHARITAAILVYAQVGRKLNRAKRYARKRRMQLQREIEEAVIEFLQELTALIFEYQPEGGFRVLSELQRELQKKVLGVVR